MKKNYTILSEPPQLLDAEIEKFQDFDALLNVYENAVPSRGKTFPSGIFIAAIFMILSVIFLGRRYFTSQELTTEQNAENSPEIMVPIVPSEKDSTTPPPEKKSKEPENSPDEILTESKEIVPAEDVDKKESEQENKIVVPEEEKEEYVFVKAEPEAGMAALYSYFDENLKYPAAHVQDSISGVSVVTFSINKNGGIEDIEIETTLGEAFDRESIRLIENMPSWIPARVNGEAVKSKISLPINFQIK